MSLDRRDIDKALTGKLQMVAPDEEGDHIVYKLFLEGKYITRTKMSRGTSHREIGANLTAQMARQLLVPHKTFQGIVTCSVSREEYIKMLKQGGELQ